METVKQADVARYIAEVEAKHGSQPDKILIRPVSESIYAVQIWPQFAVEPEGYYLKVDKDT